MMGVRPSGAVTLPVIAPLWAPAVGMGKISPDTSRAVVVATTNHLTSQLKSLTLLIFILLA